MNAITPFVFEDHLVRAVEQKGQPWFIGNDVCRALDIGNTSKALERLDEDEKGITTGDTLGGEQAMLIVSEPGVFRLIFTSRKPEAERFKRWLAHDVLPKLRRDGSYAMPEANQPFTVSAEAVPVMLAKLQMVREARHLFGHERARAMWSTVGLPVPRVAIGSVAGEAQTCLTLLLDAEHSELYSLRTVIAMAMDGNDVMAQDLRNMGIHVMEEGFAVMNRHPALSALFAGTKWANNQWGMALRHVSGAIGHGTLRSGQHVSRGTFIPDLQLDWRSNE